MAKPSSRKQVAKRRIERRLEKLADRLADARWGLDDTAEKKLPPDQKLYSKFKRSVYMLVRDCLEHNLMDVIYDAVNWQYEGQNTFKPLPHNRENPFYWGFWAVVDPDDKIPKTTRTRFSQELLYAHLHDVPPEFLIGFIHQKGTSKGLQAKIDQKQMQPWFEKRAKMRPTKKNA